MATVAQAYSGEPTTVIDEQFCLLAEHLPVICWCAGPTGGVRWINGRWFEFTGAAPPATKDKVEHGVIDLQELAKLFDTKHPSVAAGQAFDVVISLQGADGASRPFLTHAKPIRDATGALAGWVGTCTEVTQQLEAERLQAFLLRLGDRTREESDPEAILKLTADAIGTELGVDRIVYATVDWDTDIMHVSSDWRADGTLVPAHRLPMSVFSEDYVTTHSRGEPLSSSDVSTDPDVAPALRERLHGFGVNAFISVPLVKRGVLRAIMTAQQGVSRRWTSSELRLLAEVAERTWATLERARYQAEIASAEHRRSFLLTTSDRLRSEGSPAGVLSRTTQALGEFFGALYVAFLEVEGTSGHLGSLHSWSNSTAPPIDERWPVCALNEEMMGSLRHGRTHVVDDTEHEHKFSGSLSDAYRSFCIRAFVTVPVIANGRLTGVLSVLAAEPRSWVEADIELVEAVAERSWEALERARASVALRESEQLFRMVTEALPNAVVIAQGEKLVLGNPAFFEMVGTPPGDIAALDPTVWPGWDDFVAVVRSHPRLDNYETTMVRNGQPFPVTMGWRHISYSGQPAVIAAIVDLTEFKRAQSELARSREALHQAEKLSALGSLLAGVSHELNNPLTVVTTQAMLLEEMAHGTPLAERAEKVRRAAERCSRIVQTFLAMARQNRPERRIVHAADIARAALDLTDYPLRTAGIHVTFEVTPDLPPLHVDPDQLHQVLVNLMINAQHALQEIDGSRELVVRVQAAGEPGKLCIDVEDNGSGVPEDIRRRIFEPFFTTKPQGVGTGVGLSFSLGLVEAHGGRLELIDVPTGGTCFRITLDAATECAGAPPAAAVQAVDDGGKHGSALVVDDEPELVEALAIFVGRAGYRVDVAANGLEAIRLLEAADYDIVLSDLRMPELDGPALHDWISRAKPHLLPRIGFVTGDTLGQSAARFLGRTGCPVIEKPFTSAALRDLIESLGAK